MLPIPDGFHEVKPDEPLDCHVADPDLSPDHKPWVKPLLLESTEKFGRTWQVWCPYCGHHRWGGSAELVIKAWNDEQRKMSQRIKEEWQSKQQAENKAWLHKTDVPGLTHTDDHGP
jgi:hypothetical protein